MESLSASWNQCLCMLSPFGLSIVDLFMLLDLLTGLVVQTDTRSYAPRYNQSPRVFSTLLIERELWLRYDNKQSCSRSSCSLTWIHSRLSMDIMTRMQRGWIRVNEYQNQFTQAHCCIYKVCCNDFAPTPRKTRSCLDVNNFLPRSFWCQIW